jgi:tetratricopeptide (TPR) repeat protein
LELYQELGDDGGVAFALMCLGAQHMEKGDHESAAPFLEEVLAVSHRSGNKPNIVGTLHNLAEVERQRGNYERAKTLGMESMALAREMEDKWDLAIVLGWVGLLAVWSGDEHDLAERSLEEALVLDRELGNWAYGAYCLESFAGLAGARAQGARAARLWGAAEALRTNIGAPRPPDARLLYEPSMAAARAQLGETAWEAAFAEGAASRRKRPQPMPWTKARALSYSMTRRIAATARCHSVDLSISLGNPGPGVAPLAKPASTSPATVSTTACGGSTPCAAAYSDVRSCTACWPSSRCHKNQPMADRR